jgi:hypothetical protein
LPTVEVSQDLLWSGTESNGAALLGFASTPEGVVLVSQLYSLIAVKIKAKLGVFEVGKSKPKRLDSFVIGREDDKVALGQVQTLYPERLFVRPQNRLSLVDSHS